MVMLLVLVARVLLIPVPLGVGPCGRRQVVGDREVVTWLDAPVILRA